MAKTVLITGCSSGFGKAAALLFHGRGWNVAATMRDPGKAEWKADPRMIVPRLDVTHADTVRDAVTQTVETFGSVDVVVNNAGYGLFGALEGITPEQFRRQVDTNLVGVYEVTRSVLPLMRGQGGGTIVNISSIAGRMTFPLASAYHATKWAIEGMTESLQYELKPFNIRVKLVEPGGVKTDFNTRSLDRGEHPAYKPLSDYINHHFERMAKGSPGPEMTAEMIFRAATDTSNRLRFPVHAQPILTVRKLLPTPVWCALMGVAVGMAMKSGNKPTPAVAASANAAT